MGGTLASLASRRRTDVRVMALWDPIVLGADVHDESAQIAALQALSPAQQHDVRQSDVLAFPLNPALAAGVGAIDLCSALSSQPPALLVLETGQEGSGRRLANAAGAQGARADYRRGLRRDSGHYLGAKPGSDACKAFHHFL